MKILNNRVSLTVLATAFSFGLARPISVLAATSPTLTDSASYSVLGGQAVTNTGPTTTTGDVGVSPLSSITGFPPGIAGGNNATHLHSNDASAIAAQADNLSAFGVLDAGANADANCIGGILPSGTDLTTLSPLVPGLYCSAGSFLLTGNLTLTGTSGVWVFKTVSTLITSPGSSVTGGDPCNVWWRVGSSATLDTTTSFIGNILALNGVNAMNTGATLDGRLLGQSAATVTLQSNTITGPTCTTSSPGSDNSDSGSGSSSSGTTPGLPNTGIAPQSKSSNAWEAVISTAVVVALGWLWRARQKRLV